MEVVNRVMCESEKRRCKRLPARFDLSCSPLGSMSEQCGSGRTVNVCPDGLYFEITGDVIFDTGNLLKVELSIPPTSGELEFGGTISALGRVVRTCNICEACLGSISNSNKYGVAVEFCRLPRLTT